MADVYKCDVCNGVFLKTGSEEEALRELHKSPWWIPGDKIGVACEECFIRFKKWFDSLTEEDHKKIRAEA